MELIYIHDPMCSWCWAFAPRWQAIREALPESIPQRVLCGGLAPDTDQPMPEPLREQLQATWRRIEIEVPGTRFNHAFWRLAEPRRSTWPACRATLAAESLEAGAGEQMTAAIQRAYYLEARNPSDADVLLSLAGEIGLSIAAFAERINSPAIWATHAEQRREAESLGVMGYPSLVVAGESSHTRIPINYRDPVPTLQAILTATTPA